MDLMDLSPLNAETPSCVADLASDEDRKKGIRDIHYLSTYPAYPWTFDRRERSKENAKTFCDIAKQSGVMKTVRAEDKKQEPLLTYSQWVEKHKNDPGWVNNLEGNITK